MTTKSLSDQDIAELLELRDNFDLLERCTDQLEDITVQAGAVVSNIRTIVARARNAKTKTITTTRSIADLIRTKEEPPLPLSVIPNYMGINLCSVESMSWTKQDDEQLVSLTIQFEPAK